MDDYPDDDQILDFGPTEEHSLGGAERRCKIDSSLDNWTNRSTQCRSCEFRFRNGSSSNCSLVLSQYRVLRGLKREGKNE